MNKLYKHIISLLILISAACGTTKNLPEGEKLYTGYDIKFISPEKIKNKKQITSEIAGVISPKPNSSFLGLRPRLFIYQLAGNNPQGKFKKWLQKKGEPPVLIKDIKPGLTSELIDAKLFNSGIFKASTKYEIKEKKKSGKIIFTSFIHKPYVIADINYTPSGNYLDSLLNSSMSKSLLQKGDNYNLDQLKSERIRIDLFLKDNGYYFFQPDYILFKVDSSQDDKTVSLKLTLKNDIPEKALKLYKIHNIYIDTEYSLEEGQDIATDTLIYQEVYFLNKEMKIRPKVILRSVYFEKNKTYSRKDHNITLNRLMTMGTFKFVSIKLRLSDSTENSLDAIILLTPTDKRTLKAEFDLVSKSNDFIGPRSSLYYINRNSFNGAELLNFNLSGSFEMQFSGKYQNQYSYSVNPQIELFIPRFVLPFKIKNTSSIFIPKTRFSASYNYLQRANYFNMQSLQFIYGFKWKEDIRKEHELNPVSINYNSILNRSAEFDALLESNPFLRKSYEEQFIAGGTYSYTFNEQVLPAKKEQYFFNLATEIAGNTLSLIRLAGGAKIQPNGESDKVLGSVYSQYAKLSLDGRAYYNFKDKNKLALRIFMGAAKPYGNSSTLPYVKQFFSGGPNSIRAFTINSVGPGTFQQSDQTKAGFLQLGGDIKFETNAEYRFNIIRFFKGAVFIDAGNIWLLDSNPSSPGGVFSANTFYKEIAAGAGVGLRMDLSFFVLRLDLATPIRKPWLKENDGWVIDKMRPASAGWRSENLIFNVAIGYPF